jgi:phosphoglycolate phosphatase-like HAD superfamily hydrolase
MKEEIVIFDIDGTLADVSERTHHLQKKPKNWKAFFRGMAQDQAIRSMVRLCSILHQTGVRIVLCSGRSEEHRTETVQWLKKQSVKYHELRAKAGR